MGGIDNLVELCQPIPISLRNPTTVKKLLKTTQEKTLTINVRVSKTDWDAA
jgi:hypothetical protein